MLSKSVVAILELNSSGV